MKVLKNAEDMSGKLGDFDAKGIVDDHDFSLRNELVIDIKVGRLICFFVELNDRSGVNSKTFFIGIMQDPS